jgi:ABC-type sugar transport system ATPase subunit
MVHSALCQFRSTCVPLSRGDRSESSGKLSTIADLHVGDTLVRARIDRRQRLREGDTVHLAFSAEDVHLFDAQTRKRL